MENCEGKAIVMVSCGHYGWKLWVRKLITNIYSTLFESPTNKTGTQCDHFS